MGELVETVAQRHVPEDEVGAVGFTRRRRMVAWYEPRVLALSLFEIALTHGFLARLDRRDLFQGLGDGVDEGKLEADYRDRSALTIDYVADVGDAFDPTYTVAQYLARPTLDVAAQNDDSQPLPRADVLILGGDEVYPSPTGRYENQFVGPYREAWKAEGGTGTADLFALPGNHDWYDGLNGFVDVFGGKKPIGGWQTHQTRSYFALQLSQRWALWAVDTQLDGRVDRFQRRYFEGLAEDLDDDARVILCWSVPVWREPGSAAHGHLVEFLKLLPDGTVPLFLAGDTHHYARYSDDDGTHAVTCGGGGAFTHPTHNLPPTASTTSTPLHESANPYPSKAASRRMAVRAVAMPLFNFSFVLLTAAYCMLLGWMLQAGATASTEQTQPVLQETAAASPEPGRLATLQEQFLWSTLTSPGGMVLLAVVLLAYFFHTKDRDSWQRKFVAGFHALIQAAIALGFVWLAATWVHDWDSSAGRGITFIVSIGILGALIPPVVLGIYLWLSCLGGMNDNNAFSAFHSQRYKSFLRMHLADEQLTVTAIGIERVTRWRYDLGSNRYEPSGDVVGDMRPHLIETFTCEAPTVRK